MLRKMVKLVLVVTLIVLVVTLLVPQATAKSSQVCIAGQGFGWRDGHHYVWLYVPTYLLDGNPRWEAYGPWERWLQPSLWNNPRSDNGYAEIGYHWYDWVPVAGISPDDFGICPYW